MYTQEELTKLTEDLQANCYGTITVIRENLPNMTEQDAMNIWLFTMLAKYQLEIRELKKPMNFPISPN